MIRRSGYARLFTAAVALGLALGVGVLGSSATGRGRAGDGAEDLSKSYSAVVGKDLTADGSVLFFHQEDLFVDALQHISIVPHQTHDLSVEPTVQLYWIEIPQVEETYGYVGTFTYDDDAVPGGLSTGLNEHGVIIGMNVGYPKEVYSGPDGMLWSDFMKIVLERASTAQEGIEILGWLTETYHNTDDPGQMYVVADPKEGWVFESTPTHWVAKRVPDDGMWIMANRYRVGGEWDLGSPDIVGWAIDNGWYDPYTNGPFNWARYYTRPGREARPYDIMREERSDQILSEAVENGGVTLETVMALMRDHYEGTEYYYDPPHLSPYRNIEISRTVTSVIGHLRSDLPRPIGAMGWISLSPPATTTYLPVYSGITEVAEPAQTGVAYNGLADFDANSAWWSFSIIRRLTQTDWNAFFPTVRRYWGQFESRAIRESSKVESNALEAWVSGDEAAAREILTDFSARTVLDAQAAAYRLRGWLEGECKVIESPWSNNCPPVTSSP